jgi:HK97 family phage major capsid protein
MADKKLMLQRTARLEVDDKGRVRVALSSEYPVHRSGIFGDDWYEILEHTREAVNLARLRRGIPLLLEHTPRTQVGVIEEPELGEDRVLRGYVRFSRSAQAQEIKQDVLDNIRQEVSLGYNIHAYDKSMRSAMPDAKRPFADYTDFDDCVAQNQDASDPAAYCAAIKKQVEGRGDVPVVRVKRWTPMEASLVAMAADPTVGVGRSEEVVHTQPAPKAEELKMEKAEVTAQRSEPAASSGGAVKVDVRPGPTMEDERKRVTELRALARGHKVADKTLDDWIDKGTTVEQATRHVLDSYEGKNAIVPTGGGDSLKLTKQEQQRYSLSRGLLAMIDGTRSFELEVHEEITKQRGSPKLGGLYVPVSLELDPEAADRARQYYQRASQVVGTASLGGELKFTEPGPFIELLRNRMFVRQLGARLLTGLQGDVQFPRQTGAATAVWVTEAPTADVTESNITFDNLALAPKLLSGTNSYTRKLLAQGVRDIDMLIRDDFVQVFALGIDNKAIQGSGTNEPRGIINVSGIGSVAGGTNGLAPTYDHFVDLETEVAVDNADIGALAYLTTPRVRGKMKKVAAISASTGIPAWFQGEINGYRGEATNQVPSNLTKGTSTTICHAILFGNWQELLIGQWGDMEVVVDPYTQARRGNILITPYLMADVGVRHPVSFAAMLDALP